MEMHQVRYFLAVADARSFTRGAKHCSISQPALTTAVKKLEDELGGALFLRERTGIKLTALGLHVLPRLRRLRDEHDAVFVVADNHRRLQQVPLRIGVLCTLGPARLSGYLAAFRAAAPGVETELDVGTAAELSSKLEEAEVDLVVSNLGAEIPDTYVVTPLYDERYFVVLPPGHRLAAQETVALADLAGEPYIDRLACEMREQVTAACASREVALYAAYRTAREDWVQSLVQAGVGFAFMPEHSILGGETSQRLLVQPGVKRTVSLARSGDRALTPTTKLFWETMRRRAQHTQGEGRAPAR